MIKGLDFFNLQPFLPLKWHSKIVTAIKEPTFPSYDFNKMHDYLYARGFAIHADKIANLSNFRIVNIGEITKEDIEEFIVELGNYLHHSYAHN